MIAFFADLLKLPPAAVVGIGVGLVVVLLIATVREWIRYLGRRDDNRRRYRESCGQDRLIEKMIDRRVGLEPAVIQAIRGSAIAAAASATASEAEPVDSEVDGVVRRVVGWMRDLKPPPSG